MVVRGDGADGHGEPDDVDRGEAVAEDDARYYYRADFLANACNGKRERAGEVEHLKFAQRHRERKHAGQCDEQRAAQGPERLPRRRVQKSAAALHCQPAGEQQREVDRRQQQDRLDGVRFLAVVAPPEQHLGQRPAQTRRRGRAENEQRARQVKRGRAVAAGRRHHRDARAQRNDDRREPQLRRLQPEQDAEKQHEPRRRRLQHRVHRQRHEAQAQVAHADVARAGERRRQHLRRVLRGRVPRCRQPPRADEREREDRKQQLVQARHEHREVQVQPGRREHPCVVQRQRHRERVPQQHVEQHAQKQQTRAVRRAARLARVQQSLRVQRAVRLGRLGRRPLEVRELVAQRCVPHRHVS